MNKKQFLLLSLFACTVVSPSTMQASTARLRTVTTNLLTFAGLLAGGYTGTTLIIGYNNQNAPALDEKAELSPTYVYEKYKRQHPYEAAVRELNSMIIDDCTRLGKAISDNPALEKAAKDAYAVLSAVACKAFSTIKDAADSNNKK